MTPEEIDALTLGGYLPFDCPRCDRRRLEFFLNSDGGLCYCKCEKCGANSEDDSLSSTRRSQPYQAGFYQAGDRVKCRTSGALATVVSTPFGIALRLQWDNGGSGTYMPESVVLVESEFQQR